MYVSEYIKNTERIFPEQERAPYLRLDMNENPEGLPEWFVEEVKKEITPQFLATYPEPDVFVRKYASYLGVTPDNITTTNGSVMAIRYILETFAERGSKVVTVAPSFEMYWVTCSMLGLKHVGVDYDENLKIHVEDILAAIDENTDVVVLLNPNNPIGNVYTIDEARAVAKRAKEVGALLVIDEAYHYFYPVSFLPLISEFDNVVVLRTFSKLMSMAGLRLGAAITTPEIAMYIKKSIPGFEVNTVALLFAERIMDHPEIIDRMTDAFNEGKTYIREALTKAGYNCDFGEGNFFFLEPKIDPKELDRRMREKKILIKTFGKPLLKKYVRITLGPKASMEKFVNALLEVDR